MATLGCFYIYMALNLGLQRILYSGDKVCFSSTDYYFFVECLWNLQSGLCEKVADTIQNMSYQTKSNGTKNLSDNTFVIEPKFRELGLFFAMDKKLVGQSFHNRAGISRILAGILTKNSSAKNVRHEVEYSSILSDEFFMYVNLQLLFWVFLTVIDIPSFLTSYLIDTLPVPTVLPLPLMQAKMMVQNLKIILRISLALNNNGYTHFHRKEIL